MKYFENKFPLNHVSGLGLTVVDEHYYCSKNATTPGLPALLYQPGVHKKLEVTVLYTQVKVMVLPFVTVQLAR